PTRPSSDLRGPPAQLEWWHGDVAEAGPIDRDPRVVGVHRDVGQRQSEGEAEVRSVLRLEREGRTEGVGDDVDVQPPNRNEVAVAVPQPARIVADDAVDQEEPGSGRKPAS